MGFASRPPPLSRATKQENPRKPGSTSDPEDHDQPPAPKPSDPFKAPLLLEGAEEDSALARSEFLSREEVLRRRSRRVKQLVRYYRDQYWALMEEVRAKYREYYWEYGKSPFVEDQDFEKGRGGEVSAEDRNRGGIGFECSTSNSDFKGVISQRKCAFPGCKTKPMALTNYCHPHILSDTKQKLYKPCIFPVGQVTCGKPILRAAVPSLCNGHLQKYQRNALRALKKGGVNITSSSKVPKLSPIIAEYVKQIQEQRRKARDKASRAVSIKQENAS